MSWKKGIAGMAATLLGLASVTVPAAADSRDDLVNKQNQQEETLDALRDSLGNVDQKLSDALDQLAATQAKLPAAQDAVDKANAALASAQRQSELVSARLTAAQGELEQIRGDIAAADSQISDSKAQLGAVARAQYRGDTGPGMAEILLGSASTDEFLSAYSASRTLARTESTTLTEVSRARATSQNRQSRQEAVEQEVSALKKEADAAVADEAAKKKTAEDKKKDLEGLTSSIQKTSSSLESQKSQINASIDTTVASQNETKAQIQKIDAENAKAAAAAAAAKRSGSGSSKSGSSSGSNSGGSASNSSGYWMITPIPGPLVVTSPFGMRVYPFDGRVWMHNGVDLRSQCGQAQRAVASGTVVSTIPAAGNSTHGNQVYVNLGNVNGHSWVVVYNHLSGFAVHAGQKVSQGQTIGYTGATGKVTGCHIHFEVWRDGSVINPMSLPGF